jgi:hypothetical protein
MKWNGRNYRPAGQYIRHSKNNKDFNFEDALKPLGEKENKGNIWHPVLQNQVIMNVPEASSIPVSPTPTSTITPTPSITPTSTLTPTPSITPTLTSTPTITPTNTLSPTPTPSITPTQSSIPSGTTEADAYLSAVVAAGGTGITSTISAATRTLFTSLVSNNLYNKITLMYPMLGGNAAGCKFNAKDPRDLNAAYRLTFNGGVSFDASGMTGNGTNGYADTNFSVNNFDRYSAHLSFYNTLRTATTGRIEMGASKQTGSPQSSYDLFIDFGTPTFERGGSIDTNNVGLSFNNNANSANTGNFVVSRTGDTFTGLYKNGVSELTSTKVTNGLVNINLGIGARISDVVPQGYTTRRCAFATAGAGLSPSEVSTLSTIINTFQTSVGRNTY